MARLEVIGGPAAGRSAHLSKATTLGRSTDAQFQLDDLTVSREHARLLRNERGGYILEDLHSGNGTFVNGSRIESLMLRDGDEVRIGSNIMIFHGETTPAAIAAADRTLIQISETADDTSVVNTISVETAVGAEEASDETTTEELIGANRRLQVLCDMFRSIGTDLNEEMLLEKILDTLFRVFPDTFRGFIILREPETGQLTPRATKTIGQQVDSTLAISDTILQIVLEKKQAVLSSNAMDDPRFKDSESVASLQMRSVMCAPLLHEGEVLGFVFLDTQRVSKGYNEEGLALLAGIVNQASLAIANARMHSRLVERQRIEQDLRNAARLQQHFLPQEPPRVQGYEFADWYCSAQEVGGDFYDFVLLPDEKLGIAVGDVSGKGITAALMMAKMTGHVRFHAAAGLPVGEVLSEINRAIAASETEIFVTLLFLILDWKRHHLTMANAGHLPPVIRHASGTVETAECASGFPIGVTLDAEFPQTELEIRPEDRLCIFTDGIIEAMNEKQETYGSQKLEEVLRDCPLAPEAIVERIQQSVWQHMGAAKQSDDLTLVCFGPSGPG